ncbi:outer membrane lipoprotein chaperone LolA [Luminiphilus sp. nBUS_16]|uniref:outer membrane lipoprotein chaperone LolA n=1 Tax=Luminiphilus sp. nBUS_16 TaxID=3395315 RepID=UPI003EC07A94
MTPLVGAKWRWWVIALLCLWLLIGLVKDVKAEGLLGGIESLEGSFRQEIFDKNGLVTAQSSGFFALLRPHFFLWQITAPGRQLLISDGEFFWQYDEDLETVIRRPLEAQLNSPLAVLLAEESVLEQHYTLTRRPQELRLEPLEPNPVFTSMSVTLEEGTPTAVSVTDKLDQRIDFTLVSDGTNRLTAEDFLFTPPAEIAVTIVEP